MRVAFHGYVHDISGYGTAARAHIAALRLAGVEVEVNPRAMSTRARWAMGYREARILHAVPDQLDAMVEGAGDRIASTRTIVMSVWETTRLPRAWLEPLRRHADEIWTPSEHSAEAFREVGVPVYVIPHPVEVRPLSGRSSASSRFHFLHIGEWSKRKNQVGLIEAFRLAFPDKRTARLTLVSHNAPWNALGPANHYGQCISDDAVMIVAYRAGQLDSFYQDADAYVSLHRAEGFGLCIAEAMAHGLPVICTEGSGPGEWGREGIHDAATWVTAESVPCPDAAPYDGSMTWGEPDYDQAVGVMRYLASRGGGQSVPWAREHVRQHLSPARIGQLMRERLEAV